MFDDYPVKWLPDSEPESLGEKIASKIFAGSDRSSGIVDALRRFRTTESPTGVLQIIPRPDDEIGRFDAYVSYKPKRIFCKQSIFEGAEIDEPSARCVLAHELGHFVLHPARELRFLAADGNLQLRFIHPNESAERQAWIFADAFLISRHAATQCSTANELALLCNVTVKAANRRLAHIQRNPPTLTSSQFNGVSRVDELWNSAKVIPGEDEKIYRESDGGHCIQKSQYRVMGDLGWFEKDGRIVAWSETASYF